MCSERVECAALEPEVPLLSAATATTPAGPAGVASNRFVTERKHATDSVTDSVTDSEESSPFSDALRASIADHAKDNSDVQIALAILSNLKNAGGASLGDESSGLGLETTSGSGSAEDFSAAPSSEGGEDDDDGDATERTPLHSGHGARAVTIVAGRQAPKADAESTNSSPVRSRTIRGDSRSSAGSNGSDRSNRSDRSSSGGSGRYSGDLEAATKKSKVPDGGWGWMVVAASFVISMVADGISFSFGLLFVRFLDHFEDTRSKTSWIGSLFMAVPLMSGPVGSALVDRYGCRAMTMLGGLISASGFILSALSNSIEMLIVTFGVISGLGLGLCYVTCVVSVAFWFDKKRAFANGIGAAGTGFGTVVFSPLTNFFLNTYGWRGAILMLAGTFLHLCVCGAVMRDPDWWVEEQAKTAAGGASGAGSVSSKSQRGSSCGGSLAGVEDDGASTPDGGGGDAGGAGAGDARLEEARRMLKMGRSPEYVLAALVAAARVDRTASGGGAAAATAAANGCATGICSSSVLNLPTFVRQDESVPLEVLEKLSANKRVLHAVLDKCPALFPARSLSDNGPLAILAALPPPPPPPPVPSSGEKEKEKKAIARGPLTASERVKGGRASAATATATATAASVTTAATATTASPSQPLPPLKRSLCGVAQPSHYLKGIRVHRNSVMYRGAILNINKYKLRASSCPDIYRNSMTTIAQEQEEHWYTDLLSLLRGMADFSLFGDLHFLLMQMSTVLLFIWFIVPYFYLADHMTVKKYSETDASMIISIIGITNTVGIVVLGWAGDQPWVNVTKTYAVCLVMCGVSALAIPVSSDNFFALAAVAGLFGLFFASSFSFTPIILVQLVPLEKFTTAYGLVLLCQGIGNLIGPPLGGWLFDVTQAWDLSFYLTGIWIIVSGLLIAAIPMTKNHRLWGSSESEKEKEIKEMYQVSCA